MGRHPRTNVFAVAKPILEVVRNLKERIGERSYFFFFIEKDTGGSVSASGHFN